MMKGSLSPRQGEPRESRDGAGWYRPLGAPRISVTYCNRNQIINSIPLAENYNDNSGRVALAMRNQNSTTVSVSNSNHKRKPRESNGSRERKAVSKNTLKPCLKPVTSKKLQIRGDYQINVMAQPRPSMQMDLANSKDSYDTLRIVNEKLREMKLSESTEPIVQPYRDRSTDSYHYGQGYTPRDSPPEISPEISTPSTPKHPQPHPNPVPPSTQFPHFISIRPQHTIGTPMQMMDDSKVIKEDLEEEIESKEIIKEAERERGAGQAVRDVYMYRRGGESQAEKCGKIKFLYEPYSMNLSSNHKNQQGGIRYEPLQTPRSYESKVDKLRQNRILTSSKQPQAFEDEDKWDKILRMRQQTYRQAISRQQSQAEAEDSSYTLSHTKPQDQTALNTALKYLPNGTLEQLNPYSAHSYQSSTKNELELSSGGYVADMQLTKSKDMEESGSTNRFYQKLQEIALQYKEKERDREEEAGKEMKFSYSFEEGRDQFRGEKELFGRLLACRQLEWLLIYSQMLTYIQTKYQTSPQDPETTLITYIKIGQNGQQIYQNRILSHYIGIWLLSMGYDDYNVRGRIVENVELMFMDVDDVIQMDGQGEGEGDGGDGRDGMGSGANIRSIAEIMYNNLFYGYLPEGLQLRALLEVCRRGWQYMTFLICRIIRVLLKVKKRQLKLKTGAVQEDILYGLLEAAIEQ